MTQLNDIEIQVVNDWLWNKWKSWDEDFKFKVMTIFKALWGEYLSSHVHVPLPWCKGVAAPLPYLENGKIHTPKPFQIGDLSTWYVLE